MWRDDQKWDLNKMIGRVTSCGGQDMYAYGCEERSRDQLIWDSILSSGCIVLVRCNSWSIFLADKRALAGRRDFHHTTY